MIEFEVTGGVDPLLKAHLDKGDILFAESNAMVSMDQTLTLTSNAKGGFFQSLGRKLLNEENFFQQKYVAEKDSGDVLLAPIIPGDIKLLEVGTTQYMISDGAYLANTENVSFEIKTQSLGRALLARSGGLFIMKSQGQGKIAVAGFGSIREVDVTPNKPILVDNGHLVAWDAGLSYELTLNMSHSGFFGKLIESTTTGEGIVLKFSGQGKVYVCSRNRGGFIDWIAGNLTQLKNQKNS